MSHGRITDIRPGMITDKTWISDLKKQIQVKKRANQCTINEHDIRPAIEYEEIDLVIKQISEPSMYIWTFFISGRISDLVPDWPDIRHPTGI